MNLRARKPARPQRCRSRHHGRRGYRRTGSGRCDARCRGADRERDRGGQQHHLGGRAETPTPTPRDVRGSGRGRDEDLRTRSRSCQALRARFRGVPHAHGRAGRGGEHQELHDAGSDQRRVCGLRRVRLERAPRTPRSARRRIVSVPDNAMFGSSRNGAFQDILDFVTTGAFGQPDLDAISAGSSQPVR